MAIQKLPLVILLPTISHWLW